jgi:hypothetical protein
MCKAELNVSLEGCCHRWYHMIQPCMPGCNLLSCPNKLALEGWEIKCDFCPFCSGWPLDAGEYVLLGSLSHSRNDSLNGSLSRRSSLATTVSMARRDSRRASLTRSDSSGSYSDQNVLGSPVYVASERNKAMNQRVESYFVAVPENVMDTQMRKPSTSAGWGMGSWSPTSEDIIEDNEDIRRGSNSTSSSRSGHSRAVVSKAGSAWEKAKRRSQDLTKLFR